MKINKILLIIIILFIAFTTTACNKSEKVTEPVTIHMQVPVSGDPVNSKVYRDAVERFHTLNPLITVTLDFMAQEAGDDSFGLDTMKLLQRNEPPDIIPIFTGPSPIAEKKGLLMDLLPLQQQYGPQEMDIPQQILDTGMINGKLLELPYSVSPNVIYFNKDLFDKAKIPYPQGNWTWEQFRDISKKLKSTYGSILTYDIETFEILMGSTGKGIISPDGETHVGYMDSPEAVRTIQWLNAYYHDDTKKTAPMTYEDAHEQFDRNFNTGMVIKNGIQFSNAKPDSKDTIGVAPLPYFEGGKKANPIGAEGFAIPQKSKHPEAAWKFIEYLTLTKNEDSLKFAEGFLSTSKSISISSNQASDPIKRIFVDEMNYTVKASISINPDLSKAWNADMQNQFTKLLKTNDKDIPSKLHELALKLDQELNRLKQAEDQQTESSPQ